MAAVVALHRAYFREESTVLVASPTLRQSGELVNKVAAFARMLGIRPKGDGLHEVCLMLPNGSRIIGLPGTDGTVRGYSKVSMLIVDEAAQLPDSVYMALIPSLAVSNGDLWVMSTPLGKSGFFYDEWTSKNRWEKIQVPAEDVPRIPEEFLNEERQRNPILFRREYCCEFVEADGAIFDGDRLTEMITEDAKELSWSFD